MDKATIDDIERIVYFYLTNYISNLKIGFEISNKINIDINAYDILYNCLTNINIFNEEETESINKLINKLFIEFNYGR